METKLNMKLEKYTAQLDTMNAEIADSLTGNSVYSPEQLASAITSINQKFDEAKLQLETVRNEKLNNKTFIEKSGRYMKTLSVGQMNLNLLPSNTKR